MYIYISIYFILLFNTLKEVIIKRYSKNQINFLFLIFILFFSSMAGIRYGIGVDFFTYLSIFQSVDSYGDYLYLEPGFRLIISFVKGLGFSEQSLFFVFSFISLFFLVKGIKENSKFPMFSVFIYILVFYIGYVFNGLRQGVVMSLFIFLLKDIEQRKFKKVLLYTILGTSIHYSGILILAAYFFYDLKISRKMYITITMILLVMMVTNGYWKDFALGLTPGFIESKLNLYLISFEDKVNFVAVLQRVLILSLFIFYFPILKKSESSFDGIFKLYFLGFIFYSIFSYQGMYATRINMLFRILEIILFPYLLTININKYEKLFIIIIIIIWATIIFVSELGNPLNYPFRTIFSY